MQNYKNIELILGDDYQEYNKVLYRDNLGNIVSTLHYSYDKEGNVIYIHYCKNPKGDIKHNMIHYLKDLSQKYCKQQVFVKDLTEN
ncbi:MAG: hypothetical protein PHO01_12785 [Desulfotomaculaceae bacterium]|nr:hypothetical protein [Desulfotomaculaceae bacterium]